MCWCAPTTQQWSFISTTRGSASAPLVQAGAPDPCVVPRKTPLAESRSYSQVSEYGSRHPVEAGAEAQGMDALPRGGEVDGGFWARLSVLQLVRHRTVPSGSL